MAMLKDLSVEDFQNLVRETVQSALHEMLEDLAALTSETYLRSIQEARSEYARGEVKTFTDVFDV